MRSDFPAGGDKDNRQDEAGRDEPGEGAAGGGGDEAAGAPQRDPALPGHDHQEHDLHRLGVRTLGRDIW